MYFYLWFLIDQRAWRVLLGWGGAMRKTRDHICLRFHFGFRIMGLLKEGLDPAPRPSVINRGASFCSQIVWFVSVIFPLEVVIAFGLGLLCPFFVCLYTIIEPNFPSINTLGHERRYLFVFFSFSTVFFECLLCSMLVILRPDYWTPLYTIGSL